LENYHGISFQPMEMICTQNRRPLWASKLWQRQPGTGKSQTAIIASVPGFWTWDSNL